MLPSEATGLRSHHATTKTSPPVDGAIHLLRRISFTSGLSRADSSRRSPSGGRRVHFVNELQRLSPVGALATAQVHHVLSQAPSVLLLSFSSKTARPASQTVSTRGRVHCRQGAVSRFAPTLSVLP